MYDAVHTVGPQVVAAGGGGYGGRLPARPRTAVFREAQKHVRARLEKKWLAEFISTPEFIDRNGGSTVGGGNREASKSAKSSKAFAVRLGYAILHTYIAIRTCNSTQFANQIVLTNPLV